MTINDVYYAILNFGAKENMEKFFQEALKGERVGG